MKRTLKKTLCAALAMLLLCAFLPLFTTAHALSQREAILLVAAQELGYHEKANNTQEVVRLKIRL